MVCVVWRCLTEGQALCNHFQTTAVFFLLTSVIASLNFQGFIWNMNIWNMYVEYIHARV